VLNVPKLKSSIYADYAVAQVKGLNLNASWQYSGNKAYSPDNAVIVPGYQVVNLGARYVTSVGGTATTLRFNIDNVFDKFYWRDVTQSSAATCCRAPHGFTNCLHSLISDSVVSRSAETAQKRAESPAIKTTIRHGDRRFFIAGLITSLIVSLTAI
jgi:hypothetical protein